jgi:uracil-DNA glycosylase family 4
MTDIVRKHPLAQCEKCSDEMYKEGAFVPTYGPTETDTFIIGEAPGYYEARDGVPFTGVSGRLLDTVLQRYGLDRSEMRLGNACACRPPDNRTPTAGEIRACFPRLEAEVKESNPKHIVCLGNSAAKAILDTRTGITTLRVGPPKRVPWLPDTRVIPTIHPAGCLRQPDLFPHLVTDIGKLKRPDQWTDWTVPTFIVVDDEATALGAAGELRTRFAGRRIALDIETGVEKDDVFTHPSQLLCIGVSYESNKVVVFGEECLKSGAVVKALVEAFEATRLCCHNGKFDLQVLNNMWGTSLRLDFDTMLAHYVLDERQGVHSLGYLAIELLGSPDWKDEIKRYITKNDSYAVVPRDVLYRYNAFDVAQTLLLAERFEKELLEKNLLHVHDFLVQGSDALARVEAGGLGVDKKFLDELTETYLGTLDELECALRPWVANPRSPKQVKEALEKLGMMVESTNAETLETLLEIIEPDTEASAFLHGMLEHRREAKLYGTYVKGTRVRMRDGRVYSTFLLHGTTTGRLSSRNPNLQNVPRGSSIRNLFVPGPGNVFVQGDYSQAELRVLAVLADDDYLLEVFSDDARDIHGEVALDFFGPGWTKEDRVRAKAVVFGLAYGREAASLAAEFDIPQREAQRYLDTFFKRIPGVVAWRKWVKETVIKKSEQLQTHFGRKRRFWLITKDNMKDVEKAAYAFLPQSTASDICLSSLIALDRVLRREDEQIRIRATVHDSILVECPADRATGLALLMRDTMEGTAREVFTDKVKFKVDVSIGNNWGEV